MVPAEFKETIKKHLDKFAKKDSVFATKYKGEDKSLEECCNYIFSEAKKKASGGVACLSDSVVFGWAVHFFDEKVPSVEAASDVKVLCPTPVKSKKHQTDDFEKRQLSLFPDML